jgi:putative ABC transport system substrate-binding protein
LVASLVAIKPVETVGVLYSRSDRGSEQQLNEMKTLAQSQGFNIKAENVRNGAEALPLALKLMETSDALFLTESVIVTEKAEEILAKASSAQAVVFSQTPGLVESGALIGLEADPEEQGKLVAVHVLQALQGQKVHLLPVRQAKKVSLYLNKRTADQLGLSIPSEVASKAKLM